MVHTRTLLKNSSGDMPNRTSGIAPTAQKITFRLKETAGNIKSVSPESYFIRTGKVLPSLSPEKAKELGSRFLSSVWHKEHKKGKAELPLPTFKQRLCGGRLPKADLNQIKEQINFAVDIFARHLAAGKKTEARKNIEKLISGRMLSINSALREKTRGGNLNQMRKSGQMLHTYLKSGEEPGEIYQAIMQETTGRTYLAKGWTSDNESLTTPVHEAIHALRRAGIIRTDVPFAYAIDTLYGLEKGTLKKNEKIRTPTAEEFDRKPRQEKQYYYEPLWSIDVGARIGHWVFKNLPQGQRWDYLYQRCMGKNHNEAIQATTLKK